MIAKAAMVAPPETDTLKQSTRRETPVTIATTPMASRLAPDRRRVKRQIRIDNQRCDAALGRSLPSRRTALCCRISRRELNHPCGNLRRVSGTITVVHCNYSNSNQPDCCDTGSVGAKGGTARCFHGGRPSKLRSGSARALPEWAAPIIHDLILPIAIIFFLFRLCTKDILQMSSSRVSSDANEPLMPGPRRVLIVVTAGGYTNAGKTPSPDFVTRS